MSESSNSLSDSPGTNPKYLTAPDPNETGWPKGIPYIIGNEACERFSYYGMRAILQVHITSLVVGNMMADQSGAAVSAAQQTAAELQAQTVVHLFAAGVYAFPMIGAIVADRLLGKYMTIMSLSIVYCLGHLALAIGDDTLPGMYLGLALIAIGSGGIKPCVSAHVGDQFGKGNWNRVPRVFQWFYFSINFGSFFATLMIPWLHSKYGASVAFGVPGVLMFMATVAFWIGRKVFVHVPAQPAGKLGLLDSVGATLLFVGFIGLPMFGWEMAVSDELWIKLTFWIGLLVAMVSGFFLFFKRQSIQQDTSFMAVTMHCIVSLLRRRNGDTSNGGSGHWFFGDAIRRFGPEVVEGPKAVFRIISVFLLVSVFWALFDQHMSSWIRQAQQMDLLVNFGFSEVTLLPSQIQSLNPLMVMLLIPLTSYLIYPMIERLGFALTPLRKMTMGMFVASLAFVCVALIQRAIDGAAEQNTVSVLWQIIPYIVMTLAEVMVSITGLEFAYTQAPKSMKSTVMGLWLLAVSLGNVLVAVLSGFESLSLQDFFWVFAGLMAAAAACFGLFAVYYKYQDYSQ